MIEICALASGSNGNCYYIGNNEDAILVDAGINCKQILVRMHAKGLKPSKIRAVFITHEHNDHVCGVDIPVMLVLRHIWGSITRFETKSPFFAAVQS